MYVSICIQYWVQSVPLALCRHGRAEHRAVSVLAGRNQHNAHKHNDHSPTSVRTPILACLDTAASATCRTSARSPALHLHTDVAIGLVALQIALAARWARRAARTRIAHVAVTFVCNAGVAGILRVPLAARRAHRARRSLGTVCTGGVAESTAVQLLALTHFLASKLPALATPVEFAVVVAAVRIAGLAVLRVKVLIRPVQAACFVQAVAQTLEAGTHTALIVVRQILYAR